MNFKRFERVTQLHAIQFNPDEHPWHRSISRNNYDGKFHEPPSYTCIIPMSHNQVINAGDWIVVDLMGTAQGVIYAHELQRPEFHNIRQID